TAIHGGTVKISGNTNLGYYTTPVSIDNGGKLEATAGLTTIRTFNLNNGSIQADAGTYISFVGSAINGGFLRGAGTHLLTNNSSVSGVTIVTGTKVEQSQTFNASNLTNSGTLTNTSGLFTWDGGVNTASGTLNVNFAVQTTNFENDGVINVNNSFSNYGSNMV